MGRGALQSALKTIRLENTDNDSAVEVSSSDGVLHHRIQLDGGTYSPYSADHIIALLEKALCADKRRWASFGMGISSC